MTRILGQIVDKLYLVRLFLLFHELACLGARQFEAFERQLLLADLLHLSFQCIQMLTGEGEGRVKVIVETGLDCRADCQLDLGIQALDCLCEDMRDRMTVGITVFLVFKRVLIVRHNGSILSVALGRTKKPTPKSKLISGVSL